MVVLCKVWGRLWRAKLGGKQREHWLGRQHRAVEMKRQMKVETKNDTKQN